ncbi:MAG: 6-bladed beta-propeller, partial [Nitrosopumilaceae archaeon]
LSLDKQEYRPGEIINAEIHTTSLIANSVSFWFEDPSGKQGFKISIPITSGDTVIPHKINKDDMQGAWKMYIGYGGVTRYAIFFVKGEPVDSTNIVTPDVVAAPKLLMTLGFGTDVKFKNPRGIAVDSGNNIYVVDSGNSQIKKFDSTGKFLLLWGSFGTGYGQFKNPAGIFVDQKYVYVADTGNARIQKFDKNGNFVYTWGTFGDESGMFHTPVALAASKSGDLYVSDSGQNKILIFDSNGQYKDEIRSMLTAAAKFSSTNYITFDSKNNFYVVSNDNRILQFSDIGTFIKSFGTAGERERQFNKPSAMAMDSRGNLYVTDTDNHRVQKFDSHGKHLVSWGSLGTGSGQFKEPVGITIDPNNNVYVVDSVNNNVQKFAPYSAPSEVVIPEWVRNTAKWWAQGAILDSDFVTGIQYMINQKIINIPRDESVKTGSDVTIPSWIKINAGWWSDKKISDKDFAAGIQYLISRGIIKI